MPNLIISHHLHLHRLGPHHHPLSPCLPLVHSPLSTRGGRSVSLKNVNWIISFPPLKTDLLSSLEQTPNFLSWPSGPGSVYLCSLTFYHTPVCSQKLSHNQFLTVSHVREDDESLGLSPAFPSSKKALSLRLFIAWLPIRSLLRYYHLPGDHIPEHFLYPLPLA